MSKQTDLAYGAARERAREPVDVQGLILKELKQIRKLLEEQINEKDFIHHHRSDAPF